MEPLPSTLVRTVDGLQGRIYPPSQPLDGSQPKVSIQMDNGVRVLVPFELLELQEDGSYHLPVRLAPLVSTEEAQADSSAARVVLPVIVEELAVQRHKQKVGTVRVSKQVHEREELVDEPGFEEIVEVERFPVNREVHEPATPRVEGDTLIVPLMEEVVTVEKRLILKEELHITKRRQEIRNPQRVVLRSEKAIVEREHE